MVDIFAAIIVVIAALILVENKNKENKETKDLRTFVYDWYY